MDLCLLNPATTHFTMTLQSPSGSRHVVKESEWVLIIKIEHAKSWQRRDTDKPHLRPSLRGHSDPGRDIGVMVEVRDDDVGLRAEQPRYWPRHVTRDRGHVCSKHDLARLTVKEGRYRLPCSGNTLDRLQCRGIGASQIGSGWRHLFRDSLNDIL